MSVSIGSVLVARASSGLGLGVTDGLDLLLEIAVCFLCLGGFTAGLFGIELQRDGELVLRLSNPSLCECPDAGRRECVPSPGTRSAYLVRVVVATWWRWEEGLVARVGSGVSGVLQMADKSPYARGSLDVRVRVLMASFR